MDTMVSDIMGISGTYAGTYTGTSVDGEGWPVLCCDAMTALVVRGLMKYVDIGEHYRVPG
jgi:hypothetical protein